MTASVFDSAESHESLKNLIQEYEERDRVHNATSNKIGVGTLMWTSDTKELYVCNGKVNGKFIWTCVN